MAPTPVLRLEGFPPASNVSLVVRRRIAEQGTLPLTQAHQLRIVAAMRLDGIAPDREPSMKKRMRVTVFDAASDAPCAFLALPSAEHAAVVLEHHRQRDATSAWTGANATISLDFADGRRPGQPACAEKWTAHLDDLPAGITEPELLLAVADVWPSTASVSLVRGDGPAAFAVAHFGSCTDLYRAVAAGTLDVCGRSVLVSPMGASVGLKDLSPDADVFIPQCDVADAGPQPLRLEDLDTKPRYGDTAPYLSADRSNTTLFVGCVPDMLCEDGLRSLFEPFGDVRYLMKAAGMGCAFVRYRRREDAERAMLHLHNYRIHAHCHLRVSWSRNAFEKDAERVRRRADIAALQRHPRPPQADARPSLADVRDLVIPPRPASPASCCPSPTSDAGIDDVWQLPKHTALDVMQTPPRRARHRLRISWTPPSRHGTASTGTMPSPCSDGDGDDARYTPSPVLDSPSSPLRFRRASSPPEARRMPRALTWVAPPCAHASPCDAPARDAAIDDDACRAGDVFAG